MLLFTTGPCKKLRNRNLSELAKAGLLQNRIPENQKKKEVAENLRLGDFQQLL